MPDNKRPAGGARTIIIILAIAALLAVAYAALTRRAGQGRTEATAAVVLTGINAGRG